MQADEKGPMDQLSAHLDRGWDLVARGDLAGAMLSAKKSLELDESCPEAHNLLGYIHAQEGNADEALEHYRHAIASDETYVEAMLNAAEVLIHPLGDVESALSMVEEALDYCQTPDEVADAMLLKADAILSRGEPGHARAVLDGVPNGPFESPELPFRLGRARYDAGDVAGAAPLLRQAAELMPGDSDVLYYLGLTLEAEGDRRGATVTFLSVRELDHRHPPMPWAMPPEQFERAVQQAIHGMPVELSGRLEGALVVVCELPGAEVVADGVDPRIPVLLDDVQGEGKSMRVGRLFVYQRNVERGAAGLLQIEDEVRNGLTQELKAALAAPE